MPTVIDKIAWIHIANGHILTARSKGKNTCYLPGGKRDPGETDSETLVREIQEELTVQIKPETIKLFGAFEAQAHDKSEGVTVKMSCYTGEFAGGLSPASEIEDLVWLSYADKDRVSVVCQLIFDKLYEMELLI
ncbi:DNA mismatch repair protein MutT [Paenibacillus marchantiophytorum]|uniref:DNA mismatch repair protein MutT n=1 Tax=Paenibacillus marchantiophytorum TaxID=1619310 RepID=A0ABQ2BQH0_9BACL|nr:NUDIX domain-containing protein [Paenibacillus marchantiophytorum]GGI45159.1 DNA mismatch repair protein MutT [Paenibacillus marchantiophytorum]